MTALNLPNGYQLLQRLPEDPEEMLTYGKQTSGSLNFVKVIPISERDLMPYDHLEEIVNGIHQSLGDNQGLIDVDAVGTNSKNALMIYSIIKTVNQPDAPGATYTLRLHLCRKNDFREVLGFFQEMGMTGYRDTAVYSFLKKEGHIKEDNSNWSRDPFDANYHHGICMNMSEFEDFDSSFPDHPLSQCRSLIKFIGENN